MVLLSIILMFSSGNKPQRRGKEKKGNFSVDVSLEEGMAYAR